jgi:hypothetical protein
MIKFQEWLNSNINISDSVLDIGCGNKEYSNNIECKKVTTLDAWDKVNPDVLIDLEVKDIPFEDYSFNVILMLDFIEHLEKERGLEILEQAKTIARRVILLTPLWWQDNAINVENPDLWCYGNKYDYHKSLWTLEDFNSWDRALGIQDLENYFVGVHTNNGYTPFR